MLLSLTNFRRVSAAKIDLSRIALVAGKNEAGKTSIAQAAAALLTADPVPIPGVPKSQAGVLLHSGSTSGTIMLSTETGQTTITYPNAKVKAEGVPPYASPIAAGMVSIVDMDTKTRASTLQGYLKASPAKEDFHLAMVDIPLGWTVSFGDQEVVPCQNGRPVMRTADDGPYSPTSPVVNELWSLIEANGWEATHKRVTEAGTKAKGQWEAVTGDNYGAKKAEGWTPLNYTADLAGSSEDTLARVVTDAKDYLEGMIATTAVDASKRGDLEATADRLQAWKIDLLAAENATTDPALGHQLAECDGFVKDLEGKRAALVTELNSLPKPGVIATGTPCPHCKTVLEIRGTELSVLQTTVTPEQILERREAIGTAEKKISDLDTTIAQHQHNSSRIRSQIQSAETARLAKISDARSQVKQAETAAKELEALAPAGPDTPPESVDEHRTAVAVAEQRLAAFKAKNSADNIQRGITVNLQLQQVIGPTGVRNDVLTTALAGFNASLAGLSEAAGWRRVELDNTFAPTYGGTVYLLLSESAKFRARVILQLALALIDKSQAVVVDAADILDTTGKNGLFMALLAAGLPALVCMTAGSPPMDLVATTTAWAADPSDENTALLKLALSAPPDLAKAGIGVSYWVDGGVVQ